MDQYSQRLEKIEEELYRLMPRKADGSWLTGMTDSLSADVPPYMIDRFHAPGLELLERGGKRWRPLVMVLCCEAAGGSDKDIIPLTPLVEMAHNGSLIVDDIEDKSVERRGKPSVHLLHGDDLSINAGNLMYFNATALLRHQEEMDESLKYKILDAYCDSLRRLHFGQGLDIQWHNDHKAVPDIPVYLQMCRFKTGALARFAAYSGCLAGGGDKTLSYQAAESWEKAGVGFQILDDVKNLTTGNPGKHRGDDIVEGKKSLPVILFHKQSAEGFKEFAALMNTAGEKGIDEGVAEVEAAITMLEDSGSIKAAGEKALGLLHESLSEIRTLFPDKAHSALQCGIIESFIEKML